MNTSSYTLLKIRHDNNNNNNIEPHTVSCYDKLCVSDGSVLFQIPPTFNASQAMAFDGCFHDNDMELTPFPRMAPTLTSDPLTMPSQMSDTRPTEGTRLRRQRSIRENVDLLVSNSYLIDSYSRLAFPLSYLLFNTIYWGLYS